MPSVGYRLLVHNIYQFRTLCPSLMFAIVTNLQYLFGYVKNVGQSLQLHEQVNVCYFSLICLTQIIPCAIAGVRGTYMWHTLVGDERCGVPVFCYMDSTHLSYNEVGSTVCLQIDCRCEASVTWGCCQKLDSLTHAIGQPLTSRCVTSQSEISEQDNPVITVVQWLATYKKIFY